VQFVKFNKGSEGREDNKKKGGALDYSLRLRLGNLQTVYLGKFYWELMVRSFERNWEYKLMRMFIFKELGV
jgi:hypothetical protein